MNLILLGLLILMGLVWIVLSRKEVEVIGTFWERKDASKLKEMADSRVI